MPIIYANKNIIFIFALVDIPVINRYISFIFFNQMSIMSQM